ncbi:MAG TPA: SUKH-3 domain-containing protein [Bacillota bacterium]|nr:SUKH-3 domain-containing protein [Bacillota bacterium]
MSTKLDVTAILQNAGWFVGRRIDTAKLTEHYRKYGFEVFPALVRFMEEFGMLELVIPEPDQTGDPERHHTHPEWVVGDYYRYGCFQVEESYAGEKLIPVGEACNENLLLFVSESGKIYHSTGKLGDNAWEAWEALINQTGFQDWADLQN